MIDVELAVCIITALGGVLVALIEVRKTKHDAMTANRLTRIETSIERLESKA